MDIKSKINEIIDGIKEKLPRKKSMDEGNTAPVESEAETKQDNEAPLQSTEEDNTPFDTNEDSNKKKKLIIQVVLGALILYLVYDQFLSSPPPVAENPPPEKSYNNSQQSSPP